jgi:hypothetical protein
VPAQVVAEPAWAVEREQAPVVLAPEREEARAPEREEEAVLAA